MIDNMRGIKQTWHVMLWLHRLKQWRSENASLLRASE